MKKIVYMLVFLVMVSVVGAVDVAVVVEFGDGSLYTKCVTVDEETNGRQILEETDLDVLWSPTSAFGSLICKINGEGTDVSGDYCEYFGEFWNFNILIDNTWGHMPVGHDAPGDCWNRDMGSWDGHYCGLQGDVIGYKFTDFGVPSQIITFEEICPEIRLAIIDLEVDVDGDDDNLKEGDTIKDVKPGSDVEFEIEIENLNKRGGLEINDIEIEITIEDMDDDLEAESDEFDLKAGSKKSETLRLDIPLEVDEDTYDVVIMVTCEQEDGTMFALEWHLELEIDKEKHDLVIDKAELEESSLECGESTNLDIRLINLGSEDEEISLKIENRDLGLLIEEEIELDEGEDGVYTSYYSISTTEDIESGNYPIKVTALYDDGDKKETKTVDLAVECSVVEEKTEQEIMEIPEIEEEETEEDMEEVTGQATNALPISKKGIAIGFIILAEAIVAIAVIFVFTKLLKD